MLTVLLAQGRTPDSPPVRCSDLCQSIARTWSIAPRAVWQSVLTMSRLWEHQVPYVDFVGNPGTFGVPEAPARFTSCRLTRAGAFQAIALAEGRSSPIDLINGDLATGGLRPPLARATVMALLRDAVHDPDRVVAGAIVLNELDIVEPSGGSIVIDDLRGLVDGRRVHGAIGSRTVAEGRFVWVHGLPPAGRFTEPLSHIKGRVRAAEVDAMTEESHGAHLRVRIDARTNEAAADLARRLAHAYPLRDEAMFQLGGPLAALIEAWVDQFANRSEAAAAVEELSGLL